MKTLAVTAIVIAALIPQTAESTITQAPSAAPSFAETITASSATLAFESPKVSTEPAPIAPVEVIEETVFLQPTPVQYAVQIPQTFAAPQVKAATPAPAAVAPVAPVEAAPVPNPAPHSEPFDCFNIKLGEAFAGIGLVCPNLQK